MVVVGLGVGVGVTVGVGVGVVVGLRVGTGVGVGVDVGVDVGVEVGVGVGVGEGEGVTTGWVVAGEGEGEIVGLGIEIVGWQAARANIMTTRSAKQILLNLLNPDMSHLTSTISTIILVIKIFVNFKPNNPKTP